MGEKRRIFIVEDDPAILETLGDYLERVCSMTVEGRFNSAEAALGCLDMPPPDLFIVDLELPGMSGVELISRLKEQTPELIVLAYTGRGDKQAILSALKAGASGYVVKGGGPGELLSAIEDAFLGGAPLSAAVSKTLVSHIRSEGESDPFLLTPREKKILMAAKDGASYDEMGDRFHISPHTVHSHMKRIFKKLGASCRRDALDKARKKGII